MRDFGAKTADVMCEVCLNPTGQTFSVQHSLKYFLQFQCQFSLLLHLDFSVKKRSRALHPLYNLCVDVLGLLVCFTYS